MPETTAGSPEKGSPLQVAHDQILKVNSLQESSLNYLSMQVDPAVHTCIVFFIGSNNIVKTDMAIVYLNIIVFLTILVATLPKHQRKDLAIQEGP